MWNLFQDLDHTGKKCGVDLLCEVLSQFPLEIGSWMLCPHRLDMPIFLVPNTSSTVDIVTSSADAML